MALTDTFPTQDAGGLSITDARLVMAGLVAQNADGTPRPGVLASGTAPLVTGKASMAYDVAPFKAALSRIAGGVELVANDALVSVATTAAPSVNSRLDVIYVRSRFAQHADGANVPEFGVANGVAAGIPTKPAIPAGALELATAEITSTTTTTGTAVITQSGPYTAAAGGAVRLRSATDTWDAPDGAVAFRADTRRFMDRVGGVWVSRGAGVSVRTDVAQSTGGPFVPTAVAWNLEDYDTDAMHSTVTNTSRLVAAAEGDYTVTAKLRGLSTVYATGVQLGKNGVVDPAARQLVTPIVGGGAGSFPTISKTFHLNAGEYIEVFSLGEAASLLLFAGDCFAEMVRVG